MIITEKFVFLHLHKSGGSFVNDCLLRFVPGAHEVGYHLPRSKIPLDQARLPILGFVRSPWSYYVSWYTFQAARLRPSVLFRVLSADRQLGFESTIRNMLNLGTTGTYLDSLVAALPTAYRFRGLNLPGFALAPIHGTGLGFYGYLYRYLYSDFGEQAYIGRMEDLRNELLRMMRCVGQDVSIALFNHVMTAPAVNASPHDDYTTYYTSELRDLVADRDHKIISEHSYRFGD